MKKKAFFLIVTAWSILGISKQLTDKAPQIKGGSDVTLSSVGHIGLWIANETGGGQYWQAAGAGAGGAAGWLAGAWAGAKVGAMFGTAGGPIGTVVGIVVGSAGGAV